MSQEGNMSESRKLTYRGPAAFASALAGDLRAAGIEVDMEPPDETRGFDPVTAVVVPLLVRGAYDTIVAVVRKFRERYTNTQVDVEGS
jgi:hypothetical protein